MNIEQARFNMIEQQIRPWDVLDPKVLELLKVVRREQFVPAAYKSLAFADIDIPLGHGVTMWQPKLEARALQALDLDAHDNVLEIGTGSGYFTALLAKLANHVTSVEIVPELSTTASHNLAAHHVGNVTLRVGDAANGWDGQGYDAIVLTGSVPVLPETYKRLLAMDGRLFAVVGDAPAMQAQLVTRTTQDDYETAILFETVVAPLQNAKQPQRFVF